MKTEEQKQKRRVYLDGLRAAGICQNCAKHPLVAGSSTYCQSCYDKHRKSDEQKAQAAQNMKEKRLSWISKGLCRSCGKCPPMDGTYLEKGQFVNYVCCSSCLEKRKTDEQREKDRAVKKELSSKRRSQGLCVDCGIRPLETKTFCKVCREEQLRPRKDRIKFGLCSKCGKVRPTVGKMCEGCKREANDKYRLLKDEVYGKYGGYICACCGENNKEFLTIDHINNDGHKMRKIHGTGPKMLSWLKTNHYPDIGLQVLCGSCQLGKARNKGVCPHKKLEVDNGTAIRLEKGD
jgi:hypothetical protein